MLRYSLGDTPVSYTHLDVYKRQDDLFKALVNEFPGVEFRALIPNLRGVQRAADCGCKKVKLNVSASREHNLKNLNMTPEESVAGFADCVKAAAEHGIEVSGSISMLSLIHI